VNIYLKKSRWKLFLLITATLIGGGSLWYTQQLVNDLAIEERKKVELWAEATRRIVKDDAQKGGFQFLLTVIKNNETVPVIVADSANQVLYHRNLDSTKISNPIFLRKKLNEMKEYAEPIVIDLPYGNEQYIYYTRSTLLTKLLYYPYIQLGVIFLFIAVAYYAFSSSRKAEQNQVWVGLSKETAHQLGTPISSLMAWIEIAREQVENTELLNEFEKDVTRLEKISERFSKIGSQAKLQKHNLFGIIESTLQYIRTRSSKNITFINHIPSNIEVPLNAQLFEWVIENLSKNAIDAMEGQGTLKLTAREVKNQVFVDISDTGKGLPKSAFKRIFKPGYTTKKRGWGLGLSLTRRIVEEYHFGKIFVLNAEPGKGATFRMILKKASL